MYGDFFKPPNLFFIFVATLWNRTKLLMLMRHPEHLAPRLLFIKHIYKI